MIVQVYDKHNCMNEHLRTRKPIPKMQANLFTSLFVSTRVQMNIEAGTTCTFFRKNKEKNLIVASTLLDKLDISVVNYSTH